MPKYRSKVVDIEAVQFTKNNLEAVRDLALTSLRGDGFKFISAKKAKQLFPDLVFSEPLDDNKIYAAVPTLNGTVLAREGDFIVRGTEGVMCPWKPSIFKRNYEPVETNPPRPFISIGE